MIALDAVGDYLGWIVFAVIFFGGAIAAFFSRIGDILMEWAGRGKSLGKSERRELDRLRVENHQLRDVLREVQAYDKFAATPLTTELSAKVNSVLAPALTDSRKRGA